MANERKDIKYQIEHGYKLQTLMHKVNKETLEEQQGEVHYVRYADDFIVMFQSEYEAKCFLKALEQRMAKFNLELEPTKTRILPFGRFKGTKDNFDFLGFTFYNGKTIIGKYRPVIKSSKKKLKQKKQNIKKWLLDNMHEPKIDTGKSIRKKIIGHYNYYGVNSNYLSIVGFYKYVKITWFKTLKKRG